MVVTWRPSHTTERHVARGVITWWERWANSLEDEEAKAGAFLHPRVQDAHAAWELASTAVQFNGRFLARIEAHRVREQVCDADPPLLLA